MMLVESQDNEKATNFSNYETLSTDKNVLFWKDERRNFVKMGRICRRDIQ
jgi:hypothetical protein